MAKLSAVKSNKHDPEFLQCFWDLASADSAVRIAASNKLILHIQNAATSDEAEASKPNEIEQYAVNRLVKGLASSRECARQGFAAALCQLLSRKTDGADAMIESILEILEKNTMVSSVVLV